MKNKRVHDLFEDLISIDSSLKLTPQMLNKLARREIKSQPYCQQTLFSAMASGNVALLDNYPSPLKGSDNNSPVSQIEKGLIKLGQRRKFSVRCGPSETFKNLTGRELVNRWNNPRAIVNVTDLHIRDTAVEQLVDPTNLSWFNVLPNCSDDAAAQEMMSLVVSSRGCVSDSHSDAPDSSNYCFTGEKVWLYWDTYEGKKLGLEDTSIDTVYSKCSFDMKRFLQLRSARWLTVSEGQALFLPGDYTHKVITTKKYLGVGSFYVSLPNSLRTLARWNIHGPLWSQHLGINPEDPVLTDITKHVKQRVKHLGSRSEKYKKKLGYDHLPHALNNWHNTTGKQQRQLLDSTRLSGYLQLLQDIETTTPPRR